MRSPDSPSGFRVVRRPPWREGLILVCRECDGAKGTSSKSVRKRLRRALRTVGLGRVEVASVSCVDLCPKRGVTVVVAAPPPGATVVVSSRAGVGELVEALADGSLTSPDPT